jgi:hypothetical protein
MHLRTARGSASFLCLLLAACAGSGQASAPERVDAINAKVERVHVEADRARQVIGEAYQHLSFLAAGKFDKEPATTAFARFVQTVDLAEQQSKRFREVVGSMVSAAEPVFVERQQSLATISNERMRQRSELRYSVAKERYQAITKVAAPAQDQLDTLVKLLRDHATLLAHDLNGGAIADIQDEVKLVGRSSRELDHNLESCLTAARAYIDQSAPAAAPAR